MSVTSTGSSATSINDLMSTMNAKAAGSSGASSGTDSVKADTDKFMTLLVTQLQNQDPLNPMDNSQMTSQLAQLQTVTGINTLNTTLNSLTSSYQTSEAMQATNLIGHGVLVGGNSVALTGSKGVLGVSLGSDADDVKIAINDAGGNTVDTIDLGKQKAGTLPLVWNGVPDATKVDSSGKPVTLPDGNYTFAVTATSAGQSLTDATGLAYDSVGSVSTSATDGVKLYLASKGVTTLSDVKQVL
ncbi:flagellar hook assembly protein FlgD [Massilia sp. 9096]|uniref:flagellar hook assembly protein FlgD n=1 Tax=Massilia sp. 9096 TaxID=1500894 RepID=UPI0006915CFE|nr:flagellar hook assembly protein FlgD [Massilia sp. 9096]